MLLLFGGLMVCICPAFICTLAQCSHQPFLSIMFWTVAIAAAHCVTLSLASGNYLYACTFPRGAVVKWQLSGCAWQVVYLVWPLCCWICARHTRAVNFVRGSSGIVSRAQSTTFFFFFFPSSVFGEIWAGVSESSRLISPCGTPHCLSSRAGILSKSNLWWQEPWAGLDWRQRALACALIAWKPWRHCACVITLTRVTWDLNCFSSLLAGESLLFCQKR